jgi:hypothetical protein
MKKLFLVCLMMLAGSAWAEWVVYDKDEEDGTFYYDPATIRKDGNMRRVWLLRNFNQRDKDGAMSNRHRMEIDCKQERFKFLALSAHSEPMAGGTFLVQSGETNNWTAIPPNTTAETIYNIVCAK